MRDSENLVFSDIWRSVKNNDTNTMNFKDLERVSLKISLNTIYMVY